MIGALVHLLIVLLFVGLAWWALTQLLPLVPLPPQIATMIRVILTVIIALIVIYYAILPLLHLGLRSCC